MAAEFMRENQQDFIPFLTNNEGNPLDIDDFKQYCDKVENTAEWGGQLEVRPVSRHHIFAFIELSIRYKRYQDTLKNTSKYIKPKDRHWILEKSLEVTQSCYRKSLFGHAPVNIIILLAIIFTPSD